MRVLPSNSYSSITDIKLPQVIAADGTYAGTFDTFKQAAENRTLKTFLKLTK